MTNVLPLHPSHDRQMPANEAAEQALLGAIMVRNDVLDDIAFLEPGHFYFAGHSEIFAAARALVAQGRTVDAVSLRSALDGSEAVNQMPGGLAYLGQLQAEVVSIKNAPDYANLIHDQHLRRGLIEMGREMTAAGFVADLEVTAADQAEDAHRRLTALIDDSAMPTAGPRPIGDSVGGMIDQLAAVMGSKGEVYGASTGLIDLDRMIGGLIAPDLLVLAARPGMGKSALALNIARHVAEHEGPVIFYSLEMSSEQLIQRLVTGISGVPVERQRAGPISQAEFVALREAAQEVARLPLLVDDGQQRTVAAMRAHARRLKRRGGLALVVIDYLQLMVGGRQENRVAEVSQITRDVKMAAKDIGVPILALSQLSRKVEERTDKRPLLSDLRESGSIEQDADQVAFIYRPEVYMRDADNYERMRVAGDAEIIIGKNRHGREGTVHCRWDGARQRFSDRPGAGQEDML